MHVTQAVPPNAKNRKPCATHKRIRGTYRSRNLEAVTVMHRSQISTFFFSMYDEKLLRKHISSYSSYLDTSSTPHCTHLCAARSFALTAERMLFCKQLNPTALDHADRVLIGPTRRS